MKSLNLIENCIICNDKETAIKDLEYNILERKFKLKKIVDAFVSVLSKELEAIEYEKQLLFKLQNNIEITDFQTFNCKKPD